MITTTANQAILMAQFGGVLYSDEKQLNKLCMIHIINMIEGSIDGLIENLNKKSTAEDVYKLMVNKQAYHDALSDLIDDMKLQLLDQFSKINLEKVVELKGIEYDSNLNVDDVHFKINEIV